MSSAITRINFFLSPARLLDGHTFCNQSVRRKKKKENLNRLTPLETSQTRHKRKILVPSASRRRRRFVHSFALFFRPPGYFGTTKRYREERRMVHFSSQPLTVASPEKQEVQNALQEINTRSLKPVCPRQLWFQGGSS